MQNQSAAKAVAAEALAESRTGNGRPAILLSTGVELYIRSVPKQFIYAASKQFEEPKVPVIFIKDKGREEPNPADPDYQKALQKWAVDMSNATTDVALLRGTEIRDIPSDVMGPDSPEWMEEMEVLGLPMRDNARARYLYWLKAVAAPLDADINNLLGEIGRLTGVSESDVAEAVERFRRIAPRNEDTEASVE